PSRLVATASFNAPELARSSDYRGLVQRLRRIALRAHGGNELPMRQISSRSCCACAFSILSRHSSSRVRSSSACSSKNGANISALAQPSRPASHRVRARWHRAIARPRLALISACFRDTEIQKPPLLEFELHHSGLHSLLAPARRPRSSPSNAAILTRKSS